MKRKRKQETIPVTHNISKERIADVLCSAFEGGSNYWYRIEKEVTPEEGKRFKTFPDLGDGTSYLDLPLSEGGALIVSDFNGVNEGETPKKRTLNLSSIQRGLKVMAEKYPRHFGHFLDEERADSITGDVFLQCCLFGEIVYG
jgi:hypothetical protein